MPEGKAGQNDNNGANWQSAPTAEYNNAVGTTTPATPENETESVCRKPQPLGYIANNDIVTKHRLVTDRRGSVDCG